MRRPSPLRSGLLALSLGGLAIGCRPAPLSLPSARPEGCARAEAYDRDGLTEDLAWLASPELDGRYPGTPGDAEARAFVAERMACLGLEEVPGGEGYQHPFTDAEGNNTANVLGRVPGSSAAVGDELVVITAHLDHLGDGLLGANDNASGVTALLAIAQDLMGRGAATERTVVFAVVGSEESGLEGSEQLMADPPAGFNPERVVYNLNLDMVGSYLDSGTLYALGTFAGTEGRGVIAELGAAQPVLDVTLGEGSELSDNATFCARGVPYVFFWTDDPTCYHRDCDTSGYIDFEGLVAVSVLVGETALGLANSEADLAAAARSGQDVCLAE